VSQVLQQLEFSVCALGQYGCTEGLHDLFHGDGLAGQLIPRRAVRSSASGRVSRSSGHIPHQTKAPIPTGCKSVYLQHRQFLCVSPRHGPGAYLLVISKVVPKIWARTNSAMMGRGSIRVDSVETQPMRTERQSQVEHAQSDRCRQMEVAERAQRRWLWGRKWRAFRELKAGWRVRAWNGREQAARATTLLQGLCLHLTRGGGLGGSHTVSEGGICASVREGSLSLSYALCVGGESQRQTTTHRCHVPRMTLLRVEGADTGQGQTRPSRPAWPEADGGTTPS